MTQEEKSLVLRDICGRLPHGITIYRVTDNSTHCIQYSDITENIDQFSHFLECSGIENIKPYLRPMSSMTEDEMKTYRTLQDTACSYHYEFGDIVDDYQYFDNYDSLDYLNSIHVDYRGMIPMGLALESTEGMYN